MKNSGAIIHHTGPPPILSHECIYIQPRKVPSDAYLPAILEDKSSQSQPRRPLSSDRASENGFHDVHRPLPVSLRPSPQLPLKTPRAVVRQPTCVHTSTPSPSQVFAKEKANVQPPRKGHKFKKDFPIATSSPRHHRAWFKFSSPPKTVSGVQPQIAHSPISSSPKKHFLPPVFERELFHHSSPIAVSKLKGRRKTQDASGSSYNFYKKSWDETSTDFSVVSPMPSLDASYTAYLTPDVLTPSVLRVKPAHQYQAISDNIWLDEYDEPFVEHNPVYSPVDSTETKNNDIFSFSRSPSTPPYIYAKNILCRLENARHIIDNPLFSILEMEPDITKSKHKIRTTCIDDLDYITSDDISDESRLFSPVRDTTSIGTQTPDYPTFQYYYPQLDESDSSNTSTHSLSPVIKRPAKLKSRSSQSLRKKRRKKHERILTPLSPIAENNNNGNGLDLRVSLQSVKSTTYNSETYLNDLSRMPVAPVEYNPVYSSSASIREMIEPAMRHIDPFYESLPEYDDNVDFSIHSINHMCSEVPQLYPTASLSTRRSLRRNEFEDNVNHYYSQMIDLSPCKRFRRNEFEELSSRSIGFPTERFLYARTFNIKEDARYVYIVLALIQALLHFEQVGQ